MKALITDGKNAGRVMRLTESEVDLSDILEKDEKTGAYRMTEADANWLKETLRESDPRFDSWNGKNDFYIDDSPIRFSELVKEGRVEFLVKEIVPAAEWNHEKANRKGLESALAYHKKCNTPKTVYKFVTQDRNGEDAYYTIPKMAFDYTISNIPDIEVIETDNFSNSLF